jgi:ribosome-associated translation inhibitor RaiA
MHVEVHIPGAERIDALRAHIQGQLLLAAGVDTARVRRASVRITEFCGPERGTVLTSCRIEADVESFPCTIVAEALEPNPHRAVDKAVERLSSSLRRDFRPEDENEIAWRKPGVMRRLGIVEAASSGASSEGGSWQSA